MCTVLKPATDRTCLCIWLLELLSGLVSICNDEKSNLVFVEGVADGSRARVDVKDARCHVLAEHHTVLVLVHKRCIAGPDLGKGVGCRLDIVVLVHRHNI